MLTTTADNLDAITSRDAGQHLAIYSNYVKRYAAANPTASGSISLAALSLPAWYAASAEESNYVSGGVAYVYRASFDRASGMAMARAVGFSGAGVNDSGRLTVPGTGPTTTVLPAAVPNGAVVIVQ
jgi:hypothetical protein